MWWGSRMVGTFLCPWCRYKLVKSFTSAIHCSVEELETHIPPWPSTAPTQGHSVSSNSDCSPPEPTRFLSPWDFPGKNTGIGRHSLLQGILPTQELNPYLLHCKQILYCLSHQGSPTCMHMLEKIFPFCIKTHTRIFIAIKFKMHKKEKKKKQKLQGTVWRTNRTMQCWGKIAPRDYPQWYDIFKKV